MAYVLYALALVAAVMMVVVGFAVAHWYNDFVGALFGIGFGSHVAAILFVLISTEHVSRQQLGCCVGLSVVPVGLVLMVTGYWLAKRLMAVGLSVLAYLETMRHYNGAHRVAA